MDKLEPHDDTLNTQQTPKPAAQLPSTVPLALEHSLVERHVPYVAPVVDPELAVH